MTYLPIECAQVDQKKRTLRELTVKAAKATKDKARNGGVSAIAQDSLALVPEVTSESLPHVSTEELEHTKSLAEQLNNTAAFARANTWAASDSAASMIRVSPLHGISLEQYVSSAKRLQKYLQHDCSFLIKACAALDREKSHLALKELWRRAGGPAGTGSAQKMIDLLMRAPLVAVRVGVSDSVESSWIITSKADGVNYGRLGGLVKAMEKPTVLGMKTIAKSRLQALKRLASTAADVRLIELAALDTVSARSEWELSGRHNESAAQRQEREHKMHVALEAFGAYEELAKLDTLSEINALLNDKITDVDLLTEMEKLKSHEEALEVQDEEAMLVDAFGAGQLVKYDEEQVDEELVPELNFAEILDACDEEQTEALAQRLKEALEVSGHSIDLDGATLGDAGKQEELVQLFGEGWADELRNCLSEPCRPPADLDNELIDDLDAEDLALEDHAQEMVLNLRRELGVEAMAVDEDADDEAGAPLAAELALLANLTPKQLVTKMVARNRRRRERQAASSAEVAEAHRGLAGERGRSACLDTTLIKWPDIGDNVEAICADLGVGADAKRRDGALTINSAVNRGKGGTGFQRIRIELERRHSIVLSPRGLRDLTVARDRRMAVSKRYKGVVNLVYRRSVKRIGQDNIDDHSQNALYQLLHYLRDRTSFDDTFWAQRDDHSKLRGGSSESTRGASVTATGEGASALQHDYMDPVLSSPLYATSVLVSGCGDGGGERCLAFVKAEKLAPSTPTQHYADFYMLQEQAKDDKELRPIFFTPEGKVKPKVQLEVDGGADEDPTKRETRFLQTELLMGGPLLIKEQRRAQVGASTRESNGTPKNKVERLNGEMTRASTNFHAIPSDDVVGPLRDDATGQFDHTQLEAMWKQHAEDYRNLLDRNCGLNDASLQAYHGATPKSCEEARVLLERRPKLLLWLDPTTSKKKRSELQQSDPILIAHFEKVLKMQEHTEMLTRYSSCARCCQSTSCTQCRDAPRVLLWYVSGPSLRPVPPAMRDQDRPGHYLKPEAVLMKYAADQVCAHPSLQCSV